VPHRGAGHRLQLSTVQWFPVSEYTPCQVVSHHKPIHCGTLHFSCDLNRIAFFASKATIGRRFDSRDCRCFKTNKPRHTGLFVEMGLCQRRPGWLRIKGQS
jgi:hypothetical protein